MTSSMDEFARTYRTRQERCTVLRARIAMIKSRKREREGGGSEIARDSKKWGQVFSPFDRSIESDFCEEHPSSVRSSDESIPTFQTSRRRLSVVLVPSREHESVMFLKKKKRVYRRRKPRSVISRSQLLSVAIAYSQKELPLSLL